MTITKGLGPVYYVTGSQPRLIAQNLDTAEELAVKHSLETDGRHGILITRNGPGSFTVAVSEDVPYGTTHEREHHGA